MKNAHMSGAPVGETVIGFLWGAVERYGVSRCSPVQAGISAPALEQFTAVERVRPGCNPPPAPGPDEGGPGHPVGPQLSPLGAHFLRVY